MKATVLLLGVCLLVGCAGGGKRRIPKRSVISPVGRYIVTAESSRESAGRIVITRPGEKNEIVRFPYAKQVEVIWAPDETAVAVIEATEMENRIVIFALPSGRPLREVRKEHTCFLNPDLPCGDGYRRVYFSELIWVAPDRIQVKVSMFEALAEGLPAQVQGVVVATFPLEGNVNFPEGALPDRR